MEYVTVPGATRALSPQAVVLMDAATGAPALLGTGAVDSAGTAFKPEDCAHAYNYNAEGDLITDTATDGARVWVKTFGYTGGRITTESKWVQQ